jgi:asparagine synthase (glutamine-hydrolysing)
MIETILLKNDAFNWISKNNCYFKGYFFDKKNSLLSGFEAIDFFLHQNEESLESGNLNGIYSFVKISDEKIIIITDSINYFPIFYHREKNKWQISDTWSSLVSLKNGTTPNVNAETEFLSIGFVLDNETLDLEIFRTRAGEKLLLYNSGNIQRIPNYYFLPDKIMDNSYSDLFEHIVKTLHNCGERLVKYLNSRTTVVPLSGGFDSRLIVSILKKFNYDNVICITYGRKTSEVDISRKIAETLGYQWFFVDYSQIVNLDKYLTDKCFLDYADYAGNGSSMPYLQEYFAVKYLMDKKIIPADSVVLPGHVGDNLGGSYIKKSIKTQNNNDNKLINNLINTYFNFRYLKRSDKKLLNYRIEKTFKNYPLENKYSKKYNPYIEDWSVKEKFSKYLFNSSNVFNFFNYEVYFLLWDKELVDDFRQIPFEYRENKLLYDDVAIKDFFIPLNIYFPNAEMVPTHFNISIQKIKDKIRYFFPWKYVLSRLIKHDWLYYYPLTLEMQKCLEQRGYNRMKNYKFFSTIICKWYLDFIGFYKKF